MPSYSRTVTVNAQSAQSLYDKVSAEIDRFLQKSAIGEYEVERDPGAKTVRAKASLFSAELKCEDQRIELEVKLSLLAAPFKGKLNEGITRWLEKHFPGAVKG